MQPWLVSLETNEWIMMCVCEAWDKWVNYGGRGVCEVWDKWVNYGGRGVCVKLETNEWIEVCVKLETNEWIMGGEGCVKLETNEWIMGGEGCVWSLRHVSELRCLKLKTNEWIEVCVGEGGRGVKFEMHTELRCVCVCYWSFLYSAILYSGAHSLCLHVILYEWLAK